MVGQRGEGDGGGRGKGAEDDESGHAPDPALSIGRVIGRGVQGGVQQMPSFVSAGGGVLGVSGMRFAAFVMQLQLFRNRSVACRNTAPLAVPGGGGS